MLTRVLCPGSLRVERLPDGRRKLLRCLKVNVSPAGDEPRIVDVCAGFCMDYSSIPWGLRWLVNWDRVDIAGVVHDYIYRTEKRFTWRSRWEADLVWYRLARSGVHHANWLQAALGFVGLYFGACWVQPARPKCTAWHKTAMATTGALVLGLLTVALSEWQLWLSPLTKLWSVVVTYCIGRFAVLFGVLAGVVIAVNLFQSRARSRSGREDPNCPTLSTAAEDESE